MTRVLHLRDTDRVCGPGKTILETAKAIDGREFQLSIASFVAPERPNDYLRVGRDNGIPVFGLPGRVPGDPRAVADIVRLVREQQFDIIHSHEYKGDVLVGLAARFLRARTMSTVHGWINNSLKSSVYLKASVFALKRFDAVVAVSDATRQRIAAAGVPADRIVVIHNAIVAANYDASMVPAGAFRAQIGVPPEATLIGSVGRLSPEKGQGDLIRAMARLTAPLPQLRLVFVGSGPDRTALGALAHELGIADRVTFVEHRVDVRPVYRDIDVLALTSYTEGFPNVVLEALCMNTPVVATAVGGVPELLTDGDTGLVVPAGDPSSVAAALFRVATEPGLARDLAERGRAAVLARFEFGERTRAEAEVYRALIGTRQP